MDLTQRHKHSAVVFGTGALRVVVLFGGSKSIMAGNEISETTLLLLCEYSQYVVQRLTEQNMVIVPDN